MNVTIEKLNIVSIINTLVTTFGNRVKFKRVQEDNCSFEINNVMFFFLDIKKDVVYIRDSPGESYSLWIKRILLGEKI